MLLVGDIGGTKTTLALVDPRGDLRRTAARETYPSDAFDSLEELLDEFVSGSDERIDAAAFGVAGPVVGGRAELTNLPWVVETEELQERLEGARVFLLNDLQAIASSIPALEDDDVETLRDGNRVEGGAIAVIAPGTGLGKAFLTWEPQRRIHLAHPSEGGHVSFAPTNDDEIDLLRFLSARLDHVSVERVGSGSGIPEIYAWYRDSGRYEEPEWLAATLAGAEDPTPAIVGAAIDPERSCAICERTLETFLRILGAAAGDFALEVLATGGVYLGGGIPPRLVDQLRDGPFLEAFTAKGRFADLLAGVPVRVICNPDAALLGAARHVVDEIDA